MISADNSDTITFYYKPDPVPFVDNSYSFTQNLGPEGNASAGAQLWSIVSTTNTSHSQQIHLDSIVFRGGKVVFVQSTGRKDLGNVLLDSIIVSNYDYNLKKYSRLKSFNLLTTYFHSTYNNPPPPYNANNDTTISKYRLKLVAVQENDANNVKVKTTQFGYNTTMLPPLHNFTQDYWGYYNGYVSNQTLLQSQQVISYVGTQGKQEVFTIGSGVGANRSVVPSYMQAGILQQITYPTGGYTVFNYETNQYLAPSVTNLTANASSIGVYQDTSIVAFTPNLPAGQAGPLSFLIQLNNIASISNSFVQIVQASNNAIVYKYTPPSYANVNQYVTVTLTSGVQYYLMAVSVGGNPNQDISTYPISGISTMYQVTGTPVSTNVGGLRVKSIQDYDINGNLLTTETYKYGVNESGNGDFLSYPSLMVNQSQHLVETGSGGQNIYDVQTYSNSSIYALSTLSGSPVAYEQVSIYHGDTVNNIGKDIYGYTITQDSILITPNTLVPINSDFPEKIFEQSQGIKPIPVSWKNGDPISEAHYINNGSGQYTLEQLKSTTYSLYSRTAGRGLYVQLALECINGGCGVSQQWTNSNDFILYDYPISTGSRVPIETSTTNFASDGVTPLTSTNTEYYYGNLTHMFPTKLVSLDYNSKGDTSTKLVMYPQDMVIAGKDSTGIYAAMVAANIISPVIQFTQSKNSTQMMQSITTYASTGRIINPQNVSLRVMANPVEMRLNYQNYDIRGNLTQVAKTYGAPVSYIWGYDGAYPVAEVKNAASKDFFFESFEDGNGNTADARTGRYAYTGTYNRALTGLDPGAYLLTYWQKSGTVWTLVTTPETVPTNSNFTISLNAQVDDIRFYPANALMTTYTYDPLIGVTSTTDAKGLINYYEYDSFQRLVNIRDQYNNIVKSFCYNYAGQVSTCFIDLPSFKSAAISQTFTRGNCNTGYTGGTATYSLAAGTYVSNTSQHVADSLAQADVATYGQTYANVNGTCLQNVSFTMTNNTTSSVPTGVAVGMQITFSGPINITYTMPSSGSQVIQVPTGTYSINVGSDENHYAHHIQLGSGTAVYEPSTSFSGVSIASGSSTLTLTISN